MSVSGRRDLWTLTSSPRSAWVKRVNPSSGGLHPIECYAVLQSTEGIKAGVYHYGVRHHGLERRRELDEESLNKVATVIGKDSFLIGLSSIHWREVWKYGERGFRYSMLDSGHAYGSIAVAAARLGWKITPIPFLDSDYVEEFLGIANANQFVHEIERERGLMLVVVNTQGKDVHITEMPELSAVLTNVKWEGSPNHMSSDHKMWDIVSMIDDTTKTHNDIIRATASAAVTREEKGKGELKELAKASQTMSVETVITSRRSAHDYRNLPITLAQFVLLHSDAILNLTWPAYASLFIYAYQVTGLPTGIYALVRSKEELENLKAATEKSDFAWTKVEGTHYLPLCIQLNLTQISHLTRNDFLKEIPNVDLKKLSHEASCSQSIANQGAFSLGLVVDIEKVMEQMGPSGYNIAHLECGALGQILYLGAHALGLGATGMGCYLDDVARSSFGLEDSTYWSLYHFAIGVPTSDSRYAPYDYRANMFEGVLDECVACIRPKK